MPSFSEFVRASSANLSAAELLQQPVTELIGVGNDAGTALAAIGIDTIFDLGSSSVFAAASAVLAASRSGDAMIATDILSENAPAVDTIDAAGLELKHLRLLSATASSALSSALEVTTLRELALWPPRQLAHRMVATASGASVDALEDSAEELRPRLGQYPTERVYYDTLVMFGTQQTGTLPEITQPLSLGKLADASIGFGTPAIGAIATYAQSWYVQGVTLGQMLHSLALAPGEATRIAVVDWTRRTSTASSESIEESEQLDNATTHARALSEVQNAVANEMQSGGSMATGWSKSTSKGSGYAGSVGGGVAGMFSSGVAGVLGFGFGGSKSSQESETESRATSASWSVGSRSVMAGMSQRVNDRTEQHATSVRNRRASAVREVSQSEHEQVSTRIVANYNHMHALTIQYYEVVQVYRVAVRLHQIVRALFVPFETLDFSSTDAMERVARFRSALLGAALTRRAAELLLDDRGRVEIRSAVRVPSAINVGTLADVRVVASLARMATDAATHTAGTSGSGAVADPVRGATGTGGPAAAPVVPRLWSVRAGPIEEILPGDAKLLSIAFEDAGIDRVRVDQAGVPAESSTFVVPSSTDQIDFTNTIHLRSIQSIHIARDPNGALQGSMIIRYESEGHPSSAVVPLSLVEGERMQKVAYFNADTANRQAELLAHLQANRGHYTRAVLSSLDSASLVQLLAGLSWQGKPIADQVEPTPVAIAGNYLVLRAPVDPGEPSGFAANQSWHDLLDDRGIDTRHENSRMVPIPTAGVFAEAVLGRSNAAEKLDITRFWNWQDSPIPFAPPEISPVSTGTRGTTEDLRPGALGAPVVNLMTPTALPEAAGLSAVLGAVASGSMFRDMSGLAGTQATAQAASAGTLAAATEAGRIASENFKAATAQATEMGKAAADMWKVKNAGKSDGSSANSKSGGVSAEGARINHGKDMDQRGVSGAAVSAGDTAPRIIGESRPVFAAASEITPPTTFSRELAYSDESAAISPQLVGATTAALGSSAAGGRGVGGLLADGLDPGLQGTARGTLTELSIFIIVRLDCLRAGVASGTTLIPMRKHDNHLDFEPLYAAWTNSAQHIYVNLPMFAQQFDDLVAKGTSPDDALAIMRAFAILMVRHEEAHVAQFTSNGGQPPASFLDMVGFEEQAYGGDIAWLQTASARAFLTNDIGIDPQTISDMVTAATQNRVKFAAWKANPPADLKAQMVANDFLPKQIKGKAGYVVADMYKTSPP